MSIQQVQLFKITQQNDAIEFATKFVKSNFEDVVYSSLSDGSILQLDTGQQNINKIYNSSLLYNNYKTETQVDSFIVDFLIDSRFSSVIYVLNSTQQILKIDVRDNKQISEGLHLQQGDYYSIAQNQNILSIGSDGQLILKDIRKLKGTLANFRDTHADACLVQSFEPINSLNLFSGSEDGQVCMFDLNKGFIEDDAFVAGINVQGSPYRMGFLTFQEPQCQKLWTLTYQSTFHVWDHKKTVDAPNTDDEEYRELDTEQAQPKQIYDQLHVNDCKQILNTQIKKQHYIKDHVKEAVNDDNEYNFINNQILDYLLDVLQYPLSSDLCQLLTGNNQGQLYLTSLKWHEKLSHRKNFDIGLTSYFFSSGHTDTVRSSMQVGTKLYTGAEDGTIILWDLQKVYQDINQTYNTVSKQQVKLKKPQDYLKKQYQEFKAQQDKQ